MRRRRLPALNSALAAHQASANGSGGAPIERDVGDEVRQVKAEIGESPKVVTTR